jgi:hypothetical protein
VGDDTNLEGVPTAFAARIRLSPLMLCVNSAPYGTVFDVLKLSAVSRRRSSHVFLVKGRLRLAWVFAANAK